MKNLRIHLLFFLGIVLLSGNLFAQNSVSQASVKSKIDTIFKLADRQKYKEFAPSIVYTGTDTEKKYKVPLDPADPADLKKAQRFAKKIHAYVDISDSYELENVSEVEKDGLKQVIATVAFKSGTQALKIKFTFINVDGKILLADID